MQKSGSFHSHSRNSSGLNSSRANSPHSRTKIKLVSPLKNVRLAPKENHPPTATTPNFYARSSEHIELGGKAILNQTSQAFFARPNKPAQIPPEQIFRKTPQFCVGQPVIRVQSPQRAVSPARVCINNKCFDIGALRSQVVFVTPLHQPRTSAPLAATRSYQPQAEWPSELVIQEQNAMEELKESYESELREQNGLQKEPFETELKEIQQLQHEIAENNLQIKELLNSSRVSRQLNSSRIRSLPSQEGLAQILSQTQPLQSKIEEHAPEVSVQTDEGALQQNESKWSKFSISRSKECQIQLICCKNRQETSRVKEQQLVDREGKKSIQGSIKDGSNQLIQSRVSRKFEGGVMMISEKKTVSEAEIKEYAINMNLQASRACSEASAIPISHFQIEFQQTKGTSGKSTLPIEQEVLAEPQYGHTESHQGVRTAEAFSSTISSGKRRINNNIYL